MAEPDITGLINAFLRAGFPEMCHMLEGRDGAVLLRNRRPDRAAERSCRCARGIRVPARCWRSGQPCAAGGAVPDTVGVARPSQVASGSVAAVQGALGTALRVQGELRAAAVAAFRRALQVLRRMAFTSQDRPSPKNEHMPVPTIGSWIDDGSACSTAMAQN
jgi:hypothetical protein